MPRLVRALPDARWPFATVRAALLAMLLAAPAVAQAPAGRPELRGVWIHESSLSGGAVDATMRQIAEAGFNLVSVRTWFQGATLYPSAVVEAAGGPRQHSVFAGRDPLREALDAGRRYGLEVAAWMEYGLVAHSAVASGFACTTPGPILTVHPDWAMEHLDGTRAQKPTVSNGLCFYWMDPSHPEVVAFLRDLAGEVAARYPDLAVFEADRIRYPSTDFSYDAATIARYQAQTGGRDPRTLVATDPQVAQWRDWRRAQTTAVMRAVYDAVKRENPDAVVSSAVVPPYMIDTGQDKLQHWPTWVTEGAIDLLEPMLYLPDSDFPFQLAQAIARVPTVELFAAGIDARHGDSRYTAPAQIDEARRRGTDGVVLWCWDRCDMAGWVPTLRSSVFAEPATLPFNDRLGAAAEAVRAGAWQSVAGGSAGAAYTTSAAGSTARWTLRLLRTGLYDAYAYVPPGTATTAAATYSLGGVLAAGGGAATFTLDQSAGAGWRFLGQVLVPTPVGGGGGRWPVPVELTAGSGTTVADAVRLVRSEAFRATEALALDATTVDVRFNYAPAAVDASRFLVSGATVTAAERSAADPQVVRLTVTALAPDAPYTVEAADLTDTLGRRLTTSSVGFVYSPAALERRVAPGEAGFILNGTWQTATDAAAPGGLYRTAAGGVAANRARWTTTLAAEGRYAVSTWLPAPLAGGAERLAYLIGFGNGTRFDTVYVDARSAAAGWAPLGTYPYAAGATASLQLLGSLSAAGTMPAGAVRWQRTLLSVDGAEPPRAGSGLRVGLPFPNPTRGAVQFEVALDAAGTLDVEVFDVLGRRVHAGSEPLPAGRHPRTIALAGAPAGTYVLSVRYRSGIGPDAAETRRVTVVR